ncbi:His Kinase A (phospho-acceptor) domain-containing protein [Pseudobutyrivibrio ruminis]|uniref:Circadian input-output histidine kinase CikA n=1 Tax=Pseudobutyrivibrio ruminis TaxID=46206 RepID=A0A1H7M7A1_9FIRM|nr:ATP-binding protein [Pseudobutyrivibrio ruminis]SEL06808.1 His Kinase A (phospho-acceptor) domain-containing protein [Pseudobutyrivibrio ruminis]
MNKLRAFQKKYFSPDLPIDLVLFNIITIVGLIGGIITIPFNIINGMSGILTAVIFVSVIIDAVCIYMANYMNRLKNSTIAVCFVVGIALFPVMFFVTGGINSGMVCWFSMGLIFIFMLLDGMDFLFMLLTDVAIIIGCYVISYYHPEYVVSLQTKRSVFFDVVQSMMISAFALGSIIKFQRSIYEKLYRQAAINNDDLLEKTLQAKKAEKQAQTATEAKSNFLANMSHEIRTPINTIMGMDEMILRETSEKVVEEYALDIKTASQNLLSLINDILDITKIESGKMGIVKGEYDFMSLMHDVLNNVVLRAKEKNLELKLNIASNIPCNMLGDDIRIKQVLTNIITNAVKYTQEGYIEITTTCQKSLGEYVELTFSVKDTGIGIKPEDIKRMFESFERLEVNRNRNIEGAGLGMTITQNLLKMMGSTLNVDSTYGEGSTFSFTISQEVVNPEPIGDFEQKLKQLTSNYEYSTSFEAPNATFLVVDDNAMNRKVFVALLRDSKVKVVEAENGYDCLQLIKNQHFDMIFLDHMMPGMDGVETFKAMAKLEGNKCLGTPVIALTANAIAGAKERYLTLGFHGFLSKPVVPAQLEKTIRDFLPESLLEYHEPDAKDEARMNRVKKIELPDIEGIDWDYALLHFPDTNMVFQTAVDFYDSIMFERDEILRYYKDIDSGNTLEDYRIKVHAVKSMANTIGATALGGLAKTCEFAAKDNNIDRIKAITPILIEELEIMHDRLKVLSSDVEKPKLEDIDELFALLEMLKMSIMTHDSEQADNIMKQIMSYSYDDDKQVKLEQLNLRIMNLEEDEALADIEELQS